MFGLGLFFDVLLACWVWCFIQCRLGFWLCAESQSELDKLKVSFKHLLNWRWWWVHLTWHKFSTTIVENVFAQRGRRWSNGNLTVLMPGDFRLKGSFLSSCDNYHYKNFHFYWWKECRSKSEKRRPIMPTHFFALARLSSYPCRNKFLPMKLRFIGITFCRHNVSLA